MRALLVLGLLVAAAPAAADTCEDGRLPMGRTCCWPGQNVDPAGRTCLGTPECPAPRVAERRDCVLPPELAARAIDGADTPTTSEASADAPRRSVDEPLLIGGAVLIFTTYGLSAVLGSISSDPWLAGFSFVPFLHFLSAIDYGIYREGPVHVDRSVRLFIDVANGLAEIGGAIMIGLAYRDRSAPPPVAVLPGAPGSDLGVQLVGSF